MEKEYNIGHYVDPRKTYERVVDKFKLGHLVYSRDKEKYVVVDLKVLQEIIEHDISGKKFWNYLPIPINDLWLTLIFNFEKKRFATHSGTFFTSRHHGFKIKYQGGRYMLGYTLREKDSNGRATYNLRPQILFIHELMDILFLMKREQFYWNEEELNWINSVMSTENEK